MRPTYSVRSFLDLNCPADDGVKLSTDVYLPVCPDTDCDEYYCGAFNCGKGWPVIFIRTPYSNNDPVKKIPLAREFASRGYAVAVQDVRGRYDSDGYWEPFFNEARDGLAAQKWIAEQKWCNGNIALYGRSYEGYSVWMQAFNHHPAVKAIIPIVALPDPVVNVPWQNGSVMWNMITWSLFVHSRTNQDIGQYDWSSLFTFRPLNKLGEKLGFDAPAWTEWMKHHLKDDYWKPACYMHRMNEIDLPALHIAGWYDDDMPSTINNYPNARRLAKSRDRQYLLMGPWPHATNTKCAIGGVDFGDEEVIDLNGFILDWLDLVMNSKPESWQTRISGISTDARCYVFEMGSNTWHWHNDWPPPSGKENSFFLNSGSKGANTLNGDGSLTDEPSNESSGFDEFSYDPDNPTPYLMDPYTLQIGGPFDARLVEERTDVLCYDTPKLNEDLVINGHLFAELFVSSSAEDTEFCGKLCDVHPDGTSRQLNDGNIRLALRNSLEVPEPVPPSDIVKIKIDMWATGIKIFKGHKLRLEIASSAVPKFAPHTNTLEPPGSAEEVVIAQNRVYHSEEYPSRIILNIL